jgi:hypothetical protein
MPEGTALAVTGNMAHRIANRLRELPEVVGAQIYVGTARPFDFNGMVRHYYLRHEPWQAEVQLQLVDKHHRKRSSHEIAVEARKLVNGIVGDSGAKFAVVEMPPGPPVLQSVVAEVHGPDPKTRRTVARELTKIFGETESLVDVDNYMREPYDYWHFEIDYEKAQRRGITVEAINRELSMALGGFVLGDVKQRAGHEPINIVIQIPLAERSNISRLGDILVTSSDGVGVPLRELGSFERRVESYTAYHKDLRPVEYVVADVGGKLAAPVYGMLQVQDKLHELGCKTPDGVRLCDNIYWTGPPPDDSKSAIEWAGEWTVTYETFRDMGLAFIAALGLIYILVVWEFGNFRIPALIMAPIPLTLLGIIPAHALFFQMGWGGEFTATSMIGWIALAGIIVRNSILLVDFSVHKVQEGESVVEAVIGACKTRTRPILITALALVCGSSVIFFDPIFQGMAISLASGVLVSTILTLVVIPLGCVNAAGSLCEVAGVDCESQKLLPEQTTAAGTHRAESSQPLWVRVWGGVVTLLFAVMSAAQVLVGWVVARRQSRAAAKASAVSEQETASRKPSPRPSGTKTSTGSAPSTGETRAAAPARAKKTPTPPPAPADEARAPESQSAADAGVAAPVADDQAGGEPPPRKKIVVRKTSRRKVAKKKAAAKKALRKKVVAKKASTSSGVAEQEPKPQHEPQAKEKQAGKPAPSTPPAPERDDEDANRPRRGIRLKSPDNLSDDGLA